MPTSSGQYYLADYVAELQAMGFDGYAPADLETYVNRGYFYVARRSRWYWEQTTDAFTLTPGLASVPLWPQASGELPQFRSLDKLYITTAGKQARLKPMSEDEFFNSWLQLDLTQAQNRGTPDQYFVWAQTLYVLAPPSVSMDFIAHYHRRVVPLTHAAPGTSDLPITPPHLDEAILKAAKVRCHLRAQELNLAQAEEIGILAVFDDMSDDEAEIVDEMPERVSPDDQWL